MARAEYEFGECVDKDELKVTAVPIEDILRQHRKRFVIHTKNSGDIVLKYLPQRMRNTINSLRIFRYPEYPKLEEELEIIRPLVITGEAEGDVVNNFWSLYLQLRPSLDLYLLGCIEYPFITTLDEFDSLMESLEPTEAEIISEALLLLSAHAPDRIDDTYLALAMKFPGVEVVNKDLLDNMTLQQYDVLHGLIEAEQKAVRKMYKDMEARTNGS